MWSSGSYQDPTHTSHPAVASHIILHHCRVNTSFNGIKWMRQVVSFIVSDVVSLSTLGTLGGSWPDISQPSSLLAR